jgi:hypothetical protein
MLRECQQIHGWLAAMDGAILRTEQSLALFAELKEFRIIE